LNSTYTIYSTTVSPTGDFIPNLDEYCVPREVRQVLTAKFNARLQILSKKENVPFLNIWKLGASPKDMVPIGYFEKDRCHIGIKMASNQLDKALKGL